MSPTIYNLDDWLWDTIPNRALMFKHWIGGFRNICGRGMRLFERFVNFDP